MHNTSSTSSSSSLLSSTSLYEAKSDDSPKKGKKKNPPSFISNIRSLFTLTIVRKRQLILVIIFFFNFLFVNWLVDGDPTQGELLRITQSLEAKKGGSKKDSDDDSSIGDSTKDASWCYENVEARQQWRLSQRYAGPTFRQTIDLCQSSTPQSLFDDAFGVVPSDDEDEEDFSDRIQWKRKLVSERLSESLFINKKNTQNYFHAKCGVSHVESQFSQSSTTNASWMILPDFLKYMEATATKNSERSSEETLSGFETHKNREKLHFACSTKKAAHFGQLPLIDELRNSAEVIDMALLHSTLSTSEEITHSRRYQHYSTLEEEVKAKLRSLNREYEAKDELIVNSMLRKEFVHGTHLGTPLLQSSALAAQYVAINSCSTPSMTLANTVVVVDSSKSKQGGEKDNNGSEDPLSKNEFTAFRIWNGGPMVVAAVCRAPPFEITVEVSPASSWVEVIR